MRKLRVGLLALAGAGMFTGVFAGAFAGVAGAQSSLGGADNANVTAIPPPPPIVAAPASPPLATPVQRQPVPPGLVQTPVPPVDTDSNVDNGTASPAQNPTAAVPAAPGGPAAASVMPMTNDWVPGKTAEIGVLDKVDGGIANLNVPVGGQVVSGDLLISVLACVMRPDNAIPDAAIFLNVQSTADKTAPAIFHGWMVRSIPAAAVVGDGSETLRVANCT